MGEKVVFRKGDHFELTCDSNEWVIEYATEHSTRLVNGIGFFHMQEWLESRSIKSHHRVLFPGIFKIHEWVACLIAYYLYSACKRSGSTKLYFDGRP